MEWYVSVLKKYAVFSGRARRKEYWMFALVNTIISAVIGLIVGSIGLSEHFSNIYPLAVLVPAIAVGVRRLHDIDRSGWWILVPIWNLVLLCTNGTSGENRFGPDPKQAVCAA